MTPLPATEEQPSPVAAPVPDPSAAAASGPPSGNVRATVAGADSRVRPERPAEAPKSKPDRASLPEVVDIASQTIVPKSDPPSDPLELQPESSKAVRCRDTSEAPTPIFSEAAAACPVNPGLWSLEDDETWETPSTKPGPLPPTSPAPSAPARRREFSEIRQARPDLVDASVVLKTPPFVERDLPAPARPLNGPIILGSLALVTVIMLPLAAAFEGNRIFGVLGFCMSGFFLPFSPIAWIVGLAAEKRRREQRLRPEKRVVAGRLLGQWATLVLVAEGTVGLILIAALRLAGQFPATFWAP